MPRVIKVRGTGEVGFNMTPMIDIIFNLIIFFMLVCQFVRLDIEDVQLPIAMTAEPRDYSQYRNVVINIVDPDNPTVKIQGTAYDSSIVKGGSELTHYLEARAAEPGTGEFNVILRADEMIAYEHIARVMLAVGAAKIENWWVTTERETKSR